METTMGTTNGNTECATWDMPRSLTQLRAFILAKDEELDIDDLEV